MFVIIIKLFSLVQKIRYCNTLQNVLNLGFKKSLFTEKDHHLD